MVEWRDGAWGTWVGWGIASNFSDKKISINSLLTVGEHYGIRAHHYTNMGYIWAVCPIAAIFRPPKKMKKFLNTPLRISAGCDIMCGVETTTGRMIRSLIVPSRKEKRLDALIAR